MVDEKKKEVEEAKVVEVTTKVAPAIQLVDGTIISEQQALVIILNKINKLEKVLIWLM